MVCHTPPPPLPPPASVVSAALDNVIADMHLHQRLKLRLYPFDLKSFKGPRSCGHTPVDRIMIVVYGIQIPVFLVRTAEEGWICVDTFMKRWKRLGWLDWTDCGNGEDAWGRTVKEVEIELKRLLEKDEGEWIVGDEGWREGLVCGMSKEELEWWGKRMY